MCAGRGLEVLFQRLAPVDSNVSKNRGRFRSMLPLGRGANYSLDIPWISAASRG